ncbi:hypothetical protein GCM10011613_31100 [Cellvibrio zantedeschiae]|uniref:Beta-lactamase-related domain-containing protein n=2 Tax=Cellvibrio zantedeschiae TaxID=1237077 RepID=A0ABQ3B8Y4_9GAMM|nr:hypothetical protein GCM10011613_31100 [Cellvibrio zantedeschiae]
MSVAQVNAQNEKQISYPVAIQAERAAASSAPAAPVYKAPEPVIRPLDEASTTPPVARKKTAAKTTQEKPAEKITKTGAEKKTAKSTATKKAVANKSEKKVVSKKPAPTIAKTSAKNQRAPAKAPATASVKKNLTATDTKQDVEKLAPPMVAAVGAGSGTEAQPLSSAMKMAIAPVAAATLVKPELADEEDQLTEGTLDDEDFSGGPEPINDVKPVAATASSVAASTATGAIKNSPLPVASPREKFVLDFKNYVETKLVPRVPGLAVAIIADGKVKVLQAYGVKKVGTNDLINTDTAFRLASVSKTIAGTTAGVLVNDGLINWDTPITSVLPNVEFSNPRYGNQLTLRNIMSQSTGLPTHAGDNYIEEGLPFDAVMQKFKTVNFVCPPGKCYSYQNVTMSLLANIVLKKTGKPYEQYVKEKLFTPLGMRSASIGLEGLLATKNYALPHEVSGRGKWYTKEITQHYYRLNPAAGGNASINDMARWVLAHMGHNPEVLSPATLQAVHAKVTKNTAAQSHYGAREGVTDTHYGMGWRTFDYRGDKNFLHHGGYVFGSRSEMVFNPELQIGMVILSNCNKLPGSVVFEFLDAYEDEKRGEKRPSLVQPVKKKAKPK